jgi:surface glycoprotein (TIGR04207 family)
MNKQKKTKEITFRIIAIFLAALMVLSVATSLVYAFIDVL